MDDFNKSPDQVAADAKRVGQDAVDKAKGTLADAKDVANDAVDTGKLYAKDAVNAAGKKINGVKSQLSEKTDFLVQAINDQPVRSVIVASVVSSLLTALVISALRSDDRYF